MIRAIAAGIAHLFQRRDYLNRINVFPVPDGDTGTNMAFTFKAILDATAKNPYDRVDQLMAAVAAAALDGARGNSGAIMAQYFHGFSEAIEGRRLLTAEGFARAAQCGAASAWTAMSEPVPGTLPTVLEDFSSELRDRADAGVDDIRTLIRYGLDRARRSLLDTPNQLPALKQAGVVDAGAQGFVDLLDGIWTYIERGLTEALPEQLADTVATTGPDLDVGDHRYCTECVIEGESLDRNAVMTALQALDSSSLVVAGGGSRVRVHVHVNTPADVFLACEAFGAIVQQKADDMERQHGLLNQTGQVAVVMDSGGDAPPSEIDRLGIHVVPVRLSFGDREYLDRVSLSAEAFYDLLATAPEPPLTSQPPTRDFGRVYALLTSHGYDVVSVGLSQKLSGTTAAAEQAAGRQDQGRVRVFDSRSASAGQGLLAIFAAEAAELGMSADEVEALLRELRPLTRVVAVASDLSFAVRGGRVPRWIKWLTDRLHINPVLTANPEGRLSLAGFHRGRGARPQALARTAVRLMADERMYRVLIAHANHAEGASELRRRILRQHGRIHSCHVTEAGPALGVHLGPGGLIVGFAPQPEVLA
ncbi:DegV family protein [Elongatibacter sediminis]|uniref:DegV family protein n=1 Tax=Elongatibacter sediminis TaxID=3119006 RepID=A0AAW9RGB3_9GAMM